MLECSQGPEKHVGFEFAFEESLRGSLKKENNLGAWCTVQGNIGTTEIECLEC